MRVWVRALAGAWLLLLAPAAALAADGGWKQIQARGVLRVGTPGDYAPYALWRESGSVVEGADIALVIEMAASLGLGIQFVPTTWPSLMADARDGRFDVAVGGISITPERRREQGFTRAWIRDHKTPLARCGEQQRYDTRAEIDDPAVRVIVNPGGTNERLARRAFPASQLSVHPDNPGVFDELLAGRADVFVTDAIEARLQARLRPGLCVVEAAPDWEPVGKGMLVATDDATRRAMDAALVAALRRQAYAARLDAWLAHDWAPPGQADAVSELAHLADQRLAVVAEVARWKWNRGTPIEDPVREESLMSAQRAAARELGVPETRVDTFFGAQIAAARQLQHDLFATWKDRRTGRFQGVADLDGELRPRIDAINSRMLVALSRWNGEFAPGNGPGPLGLEQLSPRAARLALAPLAAGRGTPGTSPGP